MSKQKTNICGEIQDFSTVGKVYTDLVEYHYDMNIFVVLPDGTKCKIEHINAYGNLGPMECQIFVKPTEEKTMPSPWELDLPDARDVLDSNNGKTFEDYCDENRDAIDEMLSFCINDEQKIKVMELYKEDFNAGDDKAKRDIVHDKFNKLTDEIEASRKRNNN